MIKIQEEVREKVRKLLRDLFQFENQDLDFGIYRIMNFKRKEINEFIDNTLIDEAETQFRKYASIGTINLGTEIKQLIAEINRDFGDNTIDKEGNVKNNHEAPKIKDYINKKKDLDKAELTRNEINDVFSKIFDFFSRYYDKGDFISKKRYSRRQKYFIPYNGEEVLLHWANNDQYYVKTGEYFTKYAFRAGNYQVSFVLRDATIELNNVKDEPKFFFLCDEEFVRLDDKSKELNIYFNWRPLTEKEKDRYEKKKIQDVINADSIKKALNKVDDARLKIELSKKVNESDTYIEKQLKRYVNKNTFDYFVHKNLKGFLENELEFFLKNEVFDIDEISKMDNNSIRLMKAKFCAIEEISRKIIDYLSQIEDFQKILFEKRKFVLQSEFCLSLKLIPERFFKEIGENQRQVAEWKRLFNLDDITKGTFFSSIGKDKLSPQFLTANKSLVVDTCFFNQEFKAKLLESIGSEETFLDGTIVKSENFQALNFLMPTYEGSIKCIYLDPPYNTGKDSFLYKDNYQHSSWLALMADRLRQGRKMLKENGLIFISIDDNELSSLSSLMNKTFGTSAFVSNFVWNTEGHTDNQFEVKVNHEYVLLYGYDGQNMTLGHVVDPNTREGSNLWKGYAENSITKNGPANPFSEVTLQPGFPCKVESINLAATEVPDAFFKEISRIGYITREATKKYDIEYPIRKDRMVVKKFTLVKPCRVFSGWANVNKLKQFIENGFQPIIETDGKITFYLSENGVIYYKKDRDRAKNIVSVLRNMSTTEQMSSELEDMGLHFKYPKPKQLIKYLIKVGTDESGIVMDFFAGSGTTAQALLELKAEEGHSGKYVLVENDNCFEDVLKSRIEKLMFSKSWVDGLPTSKEGLGQAFKYIYLEQYEDTLNNIVFRTLDKTVQETLYSYRDYFLRYMLDYETRDSPARLTIGKFQNPFEYKITLFRESRQQEQTIDLVETFNYLLGLTVQKTQIIMNEKNLYKVVTGKRKDKLVIVIWRNTKNLDLKKDKKFIEVKLLAGNDFESIFVNGDCYVNGATPIESEFKRLMGA